MSDIVERLRGLRSRLRKRWGLTGAVLAVERDVNEAIAVIERLRDERDQAARDADEYMTKEAQRDREVLDLRAENKRLRRTIDTLGGPPTTGTIRFSDILLAKEGEIDRLRDANESVAVCADHTSEIIRFDGCVICEIKRLRMDLAEAEALVISHEGHIENQDKKIERLRKVVNVARNASQQCGIWADKLAIALRELDESDE